MKVLIVEDEALIAIYLEALVVGLGHQVCAIAASASGAIEQAVHAPDVALMDIRSADGTNGLDAAHEIYVRYRLRCIFLGSNLDDATRCALDHTSPLIS